MYLFLIDFGAPFMDNCVLKMSYTLLNIGRSLGGKQYLK